jgi:hypothetical protein
VIARLEVRNAGADFLNNSRPLVTAHHGWSEAQIAVTEMFVGVAQAGVVKANQHLVFSRSVELKLFYFVVSCFVPHHSSASLHSFSLRANGGLNEFCIT